jgi:hypothetical protein
MWSFGRGRWFDNPSADKHQEHVITNSLSPQETFSIFNNLYFRTSGEGKRFLALPFQRPYMMPDAATEQRISQKLDWSGCISVLAVAAVMIVISAFAFPVSVETFDDPINIVRFALAVIVPSLIVNWALVKFWLRADLKGLSRANRTDRLLFSAVPTMQIVASLVGCVVLAIGGLVYIISGGSIVLGTAIIAIFAGSAIRWVYILRHKK